MSDLVSALKKRIELTNFDANMSGRDAMFVKGITIQAANARLKPVLLAMVECVELVKTCCHCRSYSDDDSEDSICVFCTAIARLKKAVDAGE